MMMPMVMMTAMTMAMAMMAVGVDADVAVEEGAAVVLLVRLGAVLDVYA